MPKRIIQFLLVEDDDSHAELIRLSFEDNHKNHVLNHVSDGADAISYLRREGAYADAQRPDVVLLDLNLPKVNGHEVLTTIKQDDDLRTIPVVVLTTSAHEGDLIKAYRNHANSYLVKPIDFGKLVEMLKHLRVYWADWNRTEN